MSMGAVSCNKNRLDILSQATVSKMMQDGFLIYAVTKLSTRAMSLLPPRPLLTLAIKPKVTFNMIMIREIQNSPNVPGRSQKERSATSGPLICKVTEFKEKLS